MRSLSSSPDDSTHDFAAYQASPAPHNRATANGIHDRQGLTLHTVELLIENAQSGELIPDVYSRTRSLLDCLPLSTQDYSLARIRLRNAFDYACKFEFGAALFELRLLHAQLQM